jgi:hypothetical protein
LLLYHTPGVLPIIIISFLTDMTCQYVSILLRMTRSSFMSESPAVKFYFEAVLREYGKYIPK